MVDSIMEDLSKGISVALGFEAPLFVPVADEPKNLNKARVGEGSKPWSAGAGCGSLATSLPICVWTFEQLAQKSAADLKMEIRPTFHWNAFLSGNSNLFIWEAFVSGKAKKLSANNPDSHLDDAKIAARTFWDAFDQNSDMIIEQQKRVTASQPFSLVGAALIRAGLTKDLDLLSQHCLVLKAENLPVKGSKSSDQK